MKRAGLFRHVHRPEAATTAAWLSERLAAKGVEAVDVTEGADDGPLDIVFVLGGDGTLLRAADALAPTGAPLLGVNFGHLGFLSELERAELEDGVARVLSQGFDVEERLVLEAEVPGSGTVRGLNDVVVAKTTIGRAIRLGISVAGEQVVAWAADGVIVATSTGSTAYSFSAGGPIVSPRIDCLLVTPVAPHGAFARSLVVPSDEQVSLLVLPDADEAALSADGGPALPLSSGTIVTVRAAADRVRLAKLDPAPFWALVRDKFRLPADGR